MILHCVKSIQIFRKPPYSVRMWENTDQKKLCIWTLFTQCCLFYAKSITKDKFELIWSTKMSLLIAVKKMALWSAGITTKFRSVKRGLWHLLAMCRDLRKLNCPVMLPVKRKLENFSFHLLTITKIDLLLLAAAKCPYEHDI